MNESQQNEYEQEIVDEYPLSFLNAHGYTFRTYARINRVRELVYIYGTYETKNCDRKSLDGILRFEMSEHCLPNLSEYEHAEIVAAIANQEAMSLKKLDPTIL